MLVLVAAYHSHPFWNIPPRLLDGVRAEFGGLEWEEVPRWLDEGFGDRLPEASVLFGWYLPEAEFRRAKALRWIQSPATGVRRFLYPALVESDVMLTSARGAHAPFMAEHVMAWLLAHARRLRTYCSAQDDTAWRQDEVLFEHPPESLIDKTMLIVGYGATGRELARRAHAFGMRVLAVKRRPEVEAEGADAVGGPGETDDFLPRADVVVNTLPNTDTTDTFFDRRRLALLKPTAFFANVGRGSTVDEDALTELLAEGKLAGAGLDVFREEPLPARSPLWDIASVQVSPHLAGVSHPLLWDRLVQVFAFNLRRFLDGQPLRNVVDKQAGY
jgi:phosphoglycerate dehydrogenase-like enzyme